MRANHVRRDDVQSNPQPGFAHTPMLFESDAQESRGHETNSVGLPHETGGNAVHEVDWADAIHEMPHRRKDDDR